MKHVLCALCLLLLCLLAVSQASANQYLSEIEMDAKGMKLPGSTVLPVYSAPDEDAYRGAGGKACVSLKEEFLVLASTEDKTWQLIEYDVSKGEKRIGWIRVAADVPEATYPSIYEWHRIDDFWEYQETDDDEDDGLATIFLSEPGRVARDTVLTDDPCGGARKLRSIEAGEFVGIFFEEDFDTDSDWTYVITTVDGKKACGFVPSDDVKALYPVHMEGSTLVFEEGIEYIGGTCDLLDSGGFEYRDGGPVLAKTEFGMVNSSLNPFDADDLETLLGVSSYSDIKSVRLPSTLRLIGDDALYYLELDELVIPEGTEYIKGIAALYGMEIGTLYLPSTLRSFEYCSWASTIHRYEVDSRNPVLKSVDSVVYSKDGKTLICYPNGKRSLHFDVPKGTENIHAYAFYAFPYYEGYGDPLPITSLSLPIGLRRIGPCALQGLEELVSLTIPPTVVEIGPYAFGDMTSLTRLSLPEHLRGAVSEQWLRELSEKQYNGDNGNLVDKEKKRE